MADPVLPVPPPGAKHASLSSIFDHEAEEDFLKKLPERVGDALLSSYDPGVLGNELVDQKLYSHADPEDPSKAVHAGGKIVQGSYGGTQVALTQVYSQIEQR